MRAGRRRDVHDVTIAFCDLVGYTRLGEGVPAGDLGDVATRLAVLAADAARPPVRAGEDDRRRRHARLAEPAVLEAAFDLMDAARAQGEGFPPVHAGVAYGPALRRWGDWYGSAVNRAARLAERAAAGAVLADAAVRGRAGDDGRFAWSARAPRAQGRPRPVQVFVARRAGG